jgi:hypothetical protein
LVLGAWCLVLDFKSCRSGAEEGARYILRLRGLISVSCLLLVSVVLFTPLESCFNSCKLSGVGLAWIVSISEREGDTVEKSWFCALSMEWDGEGERIGKCGIFRCKFD